MLVFRFLLRGLGCSEYSKTHEMLLVVRTAFCSSSSPSPSILRNECTFAFEFTSSGKLFIATTNNRNLCGGIV